MRVKLLDATIGGAGVGASMLVENVQIPDVSQVSGIVSTIVQVVIGIVTLVGLFKKKRVN